MTHKINRITTSAFVPVLLLAANAIGSDAANSNPQSIATSDRIDPPTASRPAGEDRAWYDARQLEIEGKGWKDTESFYDRLPARAKDVVTSAVWGLARNSAGVCVRFATDAKQISARWTLTSSNLAMPHMPATGVSGLDLYVRYEGAWHWIGSGRSKEAANSEWNRASVHLPPGIHEYLLYLPLYNGIKSLEIGIPSKDVMYRVSPREGKPVCIYGTSIVQGGCASRPGMAHVSILGRHLNRAMINLGFSGAGKMEPAMATLLGELDVAAYVLDCLPNMTEEMVTQRVEPFVLALRKLKPDTPIIVVESVIPQASAFLPKSEQGITAKNAELRRIFEKMTAQGVDRLYYVNGESLLKNDGEATVDGVHPTDLGFMRMADALEPVLRQITASR